MDTSVRKSSKGSGPQSLAGDSRASEISTSSVSANLRRLFDFSQSKIPGLFTVTPKYFMLEYCESESIAYAKFHKSTTALSAVFCEDLYSCEGIQQCGFIHVQSENNSVKINLPAYRSYDPAGVQTRQYLNSKQFLLLMKLVSIEVKACLSGVREKRLEKIKKSIESVTLIPKSMSMLWQYMHLQVKLACFRQMDPPKYFEFILNKVLTDEFELGARDDCKEYLEKCLKGGDLKLPVAYFFSVLKHEKKLPFEIKVLFTESQNRESKEEKASSCMLSALPKIVGGLTVVKEGKSYLKMVNDCERLHKLYENNVHQNKCKVM